jgi:peptidoglycan/xylan/chitin deacetylase (PgdA/CDA1 family)
LDTLDKYGIKATWFILGNTGHIDYVKDIWDRGNQIGLHSQEHDYNKIYANTDNFVADIQGIGKVVSSYIGFTPTLIRFPGGSNNGYNAGKADSFKKAAAAQGWHYFDWNVSIGDSTQTPSDPDVLFNNIVEESQGCNSCCVLMHDSDFKPTTPDALPRIIEYYQSQGFTFDVLAADSYGYHF